MHMASLSCICPAEGFLGLKKKKKKTKVGRRCEKRGREIEQTAQRTEEEPWAHSRITHLSTLLSSGTPSPRNDSQKPRQEDMSLNPQIRNETQGWRGGGETPSFEFQAS